MADRQLSYAQIGMSPGVLNKLRQLADEDSPPTNVSALVRAAVRVYLISLGEWEDSYEAENEARLSRHMPARSAGS